MTDPKLRAWKDWFGFAREVLEYGYEESVAYANLRSVEEQNRASLRSVDPRGGAHLTGRRFSIRLPDGPGSRN